MREFFIYIASLVVFGIYDLFMMPRAIWRNRNDLSQYFHNVATGRDQYSNAKRGGKIDETVSGEDGFYLQKGKLGCCKIRKYFCMLLDRVFNEKDHCIKSVDAQEWDYL